jgi:GT2 family glycosyltransferase
MGGFTSSGRAVSSSGFTGLPVTCGIPDVSAAICTRDRPDFLRRALRSLISQEAMLREVLVVDNAPTTDSTRQLVEREFKAVHYFHEPIAGLDFARNRALNVATGEVVAFLDDDAVADSGWVAATQAAFAANPRLGACTGRVDALGLGTDGERLFEANGGFARGYERICLPSDAYSPCFVMRAPLIAWSISVGSGCSMAVRRKLVLDLGGFDEALDLGDALPGGGDLDILWRILNAGFEVLYEPAVRALHEHRSDAVAAARQIMGHHRALIAWLTKCFALARGKTRAEILLFLFWRLVKPGLRLVRRSFGRDPLTTGMLIRLWGHCWLGLGEYPRARRLATRRRAEDQRRKGSGIGRPAV